MKVKVKKMHPDAVLPKKAHESDYCYDVVATSEEEIAPNVWKYGIGLGFEIMRDKYPDETINVAIDFRPRSSVYKTGMILSNCIGTIDEDYRGEVSAVFYHIMPHKERYHVGDRIGQIKLGVTNKMEFEFAEELSDTDRGAGGYGSTGK